MDLSSYDTSQVTDMGQMFWECNSLERLDVSNFDTSQVTDMESIFSGCNGLTSLDVSNFDTSQVTRMSFMFNDCSGLTSLDISNFNTSQVTDMSNMFGGCSGLTSIDVSNFDTSQAIRMDGMFYGCSSLTILNLSSYDMSRSTNSGIFNYEDTALATIYTPRNLTERVSLPATYYDMEGNSYENLPQSRAGSILLYTGTKPEISKAHITAGKKKTAYNCSESINTDDITVIYYGTNGSAQKLAAADFTTNAATIDMSQSGSKTLTVTYQSPNTDEGSLTADITLTVGYLLDMDSVTITLPDAQTYDYVYNKKAKRPQPVVTYTIDGAAITLNANTDYTVSYKNNINAYKSDLENTENAPAIIIMGRGDYNGKVTKNFEIQKAPAPAAEELLLKTSAGTDGNYSVSNCFAKYGTKMGYAIETPVENDTISGNVLSGMPSVSSYGFLSYKTNPAGAAGDFATIPVTVSFQNYADTMLNVKIVIDGTSEDKKKAVKISGIEIKNSVYNKTPAAYTGTPKAELDGTDLTEIVKLTYTYSGTQADGSAYTATSNAPVYAGDYKLTVAVAQDDKTYTGSTEYSFKISKAPLTITARDMGLKIGAPLPKQEDYLYDAAGLLTGDTLTTAPTLSCNITDTAKAGTYDIIAANADAGMNYEITYKNGTLTVGETGESTKYYTVTYNMNGHGTDITNTGVKEGSLLEKPQNPQAASDAVYVYDGAKRLVEGTDYELSEPQPVKNKTDVVQITVTGKETGNYSGQSAAKKINVYEAGTQLITPECVTLDKTSVPYTGKAIKDIKVTVTVGGSTLDPKTDYKVQYQNNKDAGTAYITVTGKGKTYKGAVVVPFTIMPETIAKPNDFAIKEIKAVTFNGKLQKPAVSVSIQKNGKAKKLSKKDYTVAYKDNFHAGTATVIVTGKGNYAGLSAEATFTIAPQQIKKASLKGTQGALTLTYSKRKLKEGTDYETPTYGTPYKNKVEVTITGKGDFTGELKKKIKVSGK